MQQSFRFTALVLAVLFLVAQPGSYAWSAVQIESRYAAAVKDLTELENDKSRSARRDSWEALAARFGALRTEAGASMDGARAMFMEARVYGALALRSGSRADFTRAERAYGRTAEEYASTPLAPEALRRRATILNTHLGDKAGALKVLDLLQTKYPDHDRREAVAARKSPSSAKECLEKSRARAR